MEAHLRELFAMSSWVYLFSKFTSEALLFEALAICLLMASYGAFWILRRRYLNSNAAEIPASVVRLYLNELIGDAQTMRAQLFGILGDVPASTHHHAGPEPTLIATPAPGAAPVTSSSTSDPDMVKKIAMLEAKVAEQTSSIEKVSSEKVRLESELALTKAGGGGGSSAAPSDESQKLKEKLEMLEARLAEYSVIEDDLANLKRLQQENAKLKAQISSGAPAAQPATAAAPTSAATAPTQAPAAAAETEPSLTAEPNSTDSIAETEAALAAATTETTETAPPAAPTPAAPTEPTLSAAPETAPAAPAATATPSSTTADPNFESLVDEVEKSLNTPATAATSTESAAPTAPAKTSSTPTPTSPTKEKTDADLIAEFEKMLNS